MTKIVTQEERARIAYESNPYKQLILVALEDTVSAPKLLESSTLDERVIYQDKRTFHTISYVPMDDETTKEFDLDGLQEWVGSISPWLDIGDTRRQRVRAIAYSAPDADTLSAVYLADTPFNNTGGIYGYDANDPTSEYSLNVGWVPKTEAAKTRIAKLIQKGKLLKSSGTVRWTDTILACKVANTLISLSNDVRLLNMDEILIKL